MRSFNFYQEETMAVKVDIVARNIEVTDQIKKYVDKKASKLDRYLNDIDLIKVELTYIKSARSANDRQIAQITVHGRRALLRTEERADDIFAAFDAAYDKIQRQLERYKGKHYHGRGDGRSAAQVIRPMQKQKNIKGSSLIVRRKSFKLVPMDEEEALDQMKMLGHEDFFIFFNTDTNAVNVLYQRRDGTFGLIEPEVD
jgi:putative sigma-54 modulation protein